MPVDSQNRLRVILFKNVSEAMKSEKLLISASLPHKIIPVPKSISSDCGICLRYNASDEQSILSALAGKVDYSELRDL